MKELLNEAKKWQKELITARRWLHEHAEVGFRLGKTTAYIQEKLEEMGYAPQKLGKAGLLAQIGEGEKTFLLRADMDGLPIREETGLSYACKSGNMHACGHDMHSAMLLGAARLLKAREKSLKGRIKLLFQPAEETLKGAKDAIKSGVLENPKVNGGMMLHVMTATPFPTGTIVVAKGVSAPAADYFEIRVKGKGCHGSAPQNGVDALSAAAHILIALQEISARELSPAAPAVLTVGSIKAGEAGNAISGEAALFGTLRAFDETVRNRLKKRLAEIARGVAKAFRAGVSVRFPSGCPTLVNDESLSALVETATAKLLGKEGVFDSLKLGGGVKEGNGGSEDFAYISHEIPSVMLAIAAGEAGKGYGYPLHHPKARFDEKALSIGAAAYANAALNFL